MSAAAVTDAPAKAPAKAPKKTAAKPKTPAAHPQYKVMVTEAISTLKERGGSSRQAILKYIVANYKVGDNQTAVNARLKAALKAGVTAGGLKQSKGKGAAGSFCLGDKKEVKKPKAKKVAEKKPKSTKAAAKPKKAATAVKKPKSPKKAAVKKPKSPKKTAVKKPAAKKAVADKPKKAKSPKKAAPAKPKAAKPKVAKKPAAKKAPKATTAEKK